jgi:hypothetical protein
VGDGEAGHEPHFCIEAHGSLNRESSKLIPGERDTDLMYGLTAMHQHQLNTDLLVLLRTGQDLRLLLVAGGEFEPPTFGL